MTSPHVDVDPILDPLETVAARGYARYNVYRDWTDLMLAALQRDDDTYLDVLEGYDDREARDRGDRNADLFAAAFGELMEAMAETNADVLGATYEAFGMQSEAFGQHFTPGNICRMLAALQVDTEATLEPPVTVADPACGSGRLLIHAARQTDARTICFGQDKDELCAKLAALNCCFFNLDGAVVYGDSLTVDAHRAWVTTHSPAGGSIQEVDPDTLPWPDAALNDTDTETASTDNDDAAADAGTGWWV